MTSLAQIRLLANKIESQLNIATVLLKELQSAILAYEQEDV